jgi:hypothetical protein
MTDKLHVSLHSKIAPPPTPKDIYSSRKHNMDYVTVNGVILRTGYANKADWYLLCIRELLDNSIDFLWKYYKGAENANIRIEITKDDSIPISYYNLGSENYDLHQLIGSGMKKSH